MIRVCMPRGYGKTTQLIQDAHDYGYILVAPNYRMAHNISDRAKEMGYSDVNVITMSMLVDRKPMFEPKQKFLIDELDQCLETMSIAGYSNTVKENENDALN